MNDRNEMAAFLEEGFARYVGASEAVDVFERELQDRLLRRLEEKQDWRHFKPQRGERGRGKALHSGVWKEEQGRRIWASQTSAEPDDGWLQLELWWGSPREPDRVLACCTRYDDGYRVTRGRELADPKPPVVCGWVEGKKSRLFAVLDPSARDLDEVLRLLLDEMDRALGQAPSA